MVWPKAHISSQIFLIRYTNMTFICGYTKFEKETFKISAGAKCNCSLTIKSPHIYRCFSSMYHKNSHILHPSNIQLIDTNSDRFYLLNTLYYLCELFGANNLIDSKQYSGIVVIVSRHIVCITDLQECISCWTKLLFWMKWELAIAFEYQSCTEYVSDVLKSLTKVETFKSLWLCGECFFCWLSLVSTSQPLTLNNLFYFCFPIWNEFCAEHI